MLGFHTTVTLSVIAGVIIIPSQGTVNGIDISEFAKEIVTINNTISRPITGKTFEKLIGWCDSMYT